MGDAERYQAEMRAKYGIGVQVQNMSREFMAFESVDDCTFSYYADTNGCLPLSWLFEAAERVSVCVCLTLPRDHNKERYSSGHDTTERIIRNISRVSPNATQEVALCYNAHHNNLGDFEDYLEWIAPLQNNPVGQVFKIGRAHV